MSDTLTPEQQKAYEAMLVARANMNAAMIRAEEYARDMQGCDTFVQGCDKLTKEFRVAAFGYDQAIDEFRRLMGPEWGAANRPHHVPTNEPMQPRDRRQRLLWRIVPLWFISIACGGMIAFFRWLP